jgi:hypothetical protein
VRFSLGLILYFLLTAVSSFLSDVICASVGFSTSKLPSSAMPIDSVLFRVA